MQTASFFLSSKIDIAIWTSGSPGMRHASRITIEKWTAKAKIKLVLLTVEDKPRLASRRWVTLANHLGKSVKSQFRCMAKSHNLQDNLQWVRIKKSKAGSQSHLDSSWSETSRDDKMMVTLASQLVNLPSLFRILLSRTGVR